MAAKLEWSGNHLYLGDMAFRVGEVRQLGPKWWRFRAPVDPLVEHGNYESADDAQQDCEAEVRRLLRDAGVEVKP